MDFTALYRYFVNAGAPTDGAAGTFANDDRNFPGVMLIDTVNGNVYINTNTKASPTWTQKASGVALGATGAMAAAGTAEANNAGVAVTAAPIDHVHALGAHSHASATTGGGLGVTSAGSITLNESADPAANVAYITRDDDGDVHINAIDTKTVNLRVNGVDVITVAGAAITLAQATTITTGGLSITAGGLTVVAGGANVTGNSIVTGNLEVTGSLTFGGNWTVAATLTVDELVLDTDGVAPAGTNCYAVRDNAGDFTVNAVTGKQVIVAVNNTDEYTFSSTIADFCDNAIDNAGFVILNAAVAPAVNEVYLVNDNAGDLTLNALTGKDILFAINGVDEISFGDDGAVFNEASNDRNFRFETNGMQYAIYSDGGKDALVLGSNTDTSSADQLITISRAARANTGGTSYYDLIIAPAGAITTTGVTAIVATARFDEPNITIGADSVTLAATVYISGEPTEGGANYGLAVNASIGVVADAKDISLGASNDVLMRWSTADADNHAFAIGLGASLAMHICQGADIATDWNVAAAVNPTLYIHGAATPATEYVAISTDETDAHLNAVGANWKFEIGGTAELTLAANALNLVDSILYGSAAAHTADTADGCLYLHSTSDATKGFVVIPNAQLGLVIGSDGSVDRAGTVGTNSLSLFNGTAPAGALVNGVTFYSEGGEAKVLDAAGNSTTLSPHTVDGDYVIHSYSAQKDETVTIHLEKMLKALAADPKLAKFIEVKTGHSKKPVWAS